MSSGSGSVAYPSVNTSSRAARPSNRGYRLPGLVAWAMILVILANVGFQGGQVFYNAFLPEIAPEHERDRGGAQCRHHVDEHVGRDDAGLLAGKVGALLAFAAGALALTEVLTWVAARVLAPGRLHRRTHADGAPHAGHAAGGGGGAGVRVGSAGADAAGRGRARGAGEYARHPAAADHGNGAALDQQNGNAAVTLDSLSSTGSATVNVALGTFTQKTSTWASKATGTKTVTCASATSWTTMETALATCANRICSFRHSSKCRRRPQSGPSARLTQ